MKNWVLLGFLVLAFATCLYALDNISLIPIGDGNGSVSRNVITMTPDSCETKMDATISTIAINTAHKKQIYGFASVDRIYLDNAGIPLDTTLADDSIIISLFATYDRNLSALTKTLQCDTVTYDTIIYYNLGDGFDTLLWDEAFFTIEIRDTVGSAATDTADLALGKTRNYRMSMKLDVR